MFALPPVVQTPPARFTIEARPAFVQLVPYRDLAAACGEPWLNGLLMACSKPSETPCRILIPSAQSWPGTPATWWQVYWHERAHCNGWPGDHPK